MLLENKLTKLCYDTLNLSTIEVKIKLCQWEIELGTSLSCDSFMRAFGELYVTTNAPKQQSFQYRLLHRAVVMN